MQNVLSGFIDVIGWENDVLQIWMKTDVGYRYPSDGVHSAGAERIPPVEEYPTRIEAFYLSARLGREAAAEELGA